MLRIFLPVLLLAFLSPACFGDSEPAATATQPPPAPTSEPELTATIPPSPSPTEEKSGAELVPFTVQLIEAATGISQTLVKDMERVWMTLFGDGHQSIFLVNLGPGEAEVIEFALDGTEVARGRPEALCAIHAPVDPIAGDSFEALVCSGQLFNPPVSPDGRWALSTGGPDFPTPVPCAPSCHDLWAVEQATGERVLLQAGLQNCGGCDARFGHGWSPSGRYVFFGETGGQQRVFLSDLATRTTRQLETGNEISRSPAWAPDRDVLLRPSGSGYTIVEDLEVGTSTEVLSLPWPSRFDASGRLVYALAWAEVREPNEPLETTIVDLSSLQILGMLDGAPSFLHLWREMRPVVSMGEQTVAALEHARDCAGTAVYAGTARVTCVPGGTGAVIAPDGSKVAIARVTGQSGHIKAPNVEASSLTRYEVILLEVATGDETVVATGAIGDQSPLFQWTDDSRHLIVSWPVHSGL